jgi:outer membrane protein assembly factor BamB
MRWMRMVASAFLLAGSGAVLPAAAAAYPAATMPTGTVLTASSASAAQDSWVTFTARVSASGGVPTGSVTFTDVSNGSVLDTAALSSGTAALSIASLAAGARSVVATYGGSSSFSPSSSAAVNVAVAATGSPAVTYQVDARHDGRQARGALSAGTLVKKWSRTLGGTPPIAGQGMISYPVIARGRVFVTANDHGYQLYALNASTGATDWSAGLGGSTGLNGLAYDGQRLFDLTDSGLLTAYAASTGQQQWVIQMPGEWSFTGAPTAYDGVIYISGSGSGGTVYAVSEADGRVRVHADVLGGDGTPAVDDTGVYVSYAGPQDYRFSLGGRLMWQHKGCCSGGGGSTPVLHGNYAYARGSGMPPDIPLILSKSLGTQAGTFAADTAPAFDHVNMYTLQNGNLVAVFPSGGPSRWTFTNGSLVTAPVVSNGVVYAGSSKGRVYGVSASSGARLWSAAAGPYMAAPGTESVGLPIGMAIGGGRLVVPAGNVLTAFGD